MKHVKIDQNFIQEETEEGEINLAYIPSTQQEPDILTKVMLKLDFESLISKLRMTDIYSPAWGEALESRSSIH